MARIKTKVITGVSLDEAQEASQQYAAAFNRLKKIEVKMNDEINRVKDKYSEAIADIKEEMEEPYEMLKVFTSENKTNWGKKKSIELLHCIIGLRTGTPKVIKDKKFTWPATLELLKKNSLFKAFIRTTEEINKEAILAEKNEAVLAQLKEECYISIDQDESFFVTPKEEEVIS